MLSRLVVAFPPKSKYLLISWPQSPSAVILEPKKIKSVIVSIVSPSICHEVMGLDAMIFIFWMFSFKPAFSLSSFTFIKRLFSSRWLSAIRVVSSPYLRLLIFLLDTSERYVKAVYYNLHAEYIVQNPRLDEAQAGIKIARSINNLRHAWPIHPPFSFKVTASPHCSLLSNQYRGNSTQ